MGFFIVSTGVLEGWDLQFYSRFKNVYLQVASSLYSLLGMILCAYWSMMFEARVEGERHHCHETLLDYVQKAPDNTQREIDQHEFDEMIATKTESAPGPDGIPYSIYWCAGGLGSQFLFIACKRVIEGGAVSMEFAPSRTVFLPDDNGLIARPPDALRPLTLRNCDCKINTTAICFGLHRYSVRCIHPAQRCISSSK